MKPLIRMSNLTGTPQYYLLTRYRIDGRSVVASTKYDVTDQIEALIAARDKLPRCEHGAIREPCIPCAEYAALRATDTEERRG